MRLDKATRAAAQFLQAMAHGIPSADEVYVDVDDYLRKRDLREAAYAEALEAASRVQRSSTDVVIYPLKRVRAL